MNPTAPPQPPQPQQQPPALQPHRPSTSCDRHPEENFTGFCPSCLCERLAVLDPNASNPSTSSSSSARKSSAAALKAIFRPPASSFFPELRRTKSFSASKNEAFPGALFEPQRKSCDVRVRSTLSNLFNHDHSNNDRKITNKEEASEADNKNPASSTKVESKEEKEEEKKEEHKHRHKHEEEDKDKENENEDEIRVVEESNVSEEIVEEEEVVGVGVGVGVEEEGEELKTMKDHIDLDSSSQAKKGKGSFWSAASVFSKKLQKWRQKQKEAKKKRALPVEKPIRRHFRDTQSEVADYGFGRRSCDTDPRFSLDAGRMSLDVGRMSFDGDPRYSLDEPRASWDGYLIGRTGVPRMPTMLSVVEDAPVVNVARTDTQIPVEEPPNEDESVPGGSLQTKEYYSDSSSRRRKSLDRSNSVKRRENMDELKSVSNGSTSASAGASSIVPNNVNNGFSVANSKVTPAAAAAGVDYIHGSMRMGSFHDRDDCFSETCEMGAASVIGDRKGEKKSRRWSIWGFIHRRGRNKDDDEDRYSRVNGVERSFSESWQDGRGGGGFGGRVLRSNSSVSWRNAQGIGGGSFGSVTGRNKNGVVQGNGHGKKGKDEFVLERNRSARYSSNEVDNGLLRFYLTPLRGSRRNGSVKSSKSNQAHSIARSVLGLY